MKKLFYAALVFFCVGDFFVHKHHVSYWFDHIKGFEVYFGAFSCLIIIWFAKSVVQPGIMKKEDYYD